MFPARSPTLSSRSVGAEAREQGGNSGSRRRGGRLRRSYSVPDRDCYVDEVAYGKAVTFFEFSVVGDVHLKRGGIHLPEIRISSVRSVQELCAQRESGFLCVMAGIFVCDGGGGLHGTLLS